MKTTAAVLAIVTAPILCGFAQEGPRDERWVRQHVKDVIEEWATASLMLEASKGHSLDAPGVPTCGYAVLAKDRLERHLKKYAASREEDRRFVIERIERAKTMLEKAVEEMESRRNGLMIVGRRLTPDEEREIRALGDGMLHHKAVAEDLKRLRKEIEKTPGALREIDKDNPLNPLLKIKKRLDEGMAAFLKGSSLEDAFEPWRAKTRSSIDQDEVRARIRTAGVVSADFFGFEYRLRLHSEGKAVYYLRTFVHIGGDRVDFLEFKGHKLDDPGVMARCTIDDFKGPARPFADAATAILKTMKEDGGKNILFIDLEKMKGFLPPEAIREVKEELDESAEKLEETCRGLASTDYDQVEIRLDDLVYLALDDKGEVKGVIGGEFEFDPEKGLEFELKGFQPLK